MLKKLLKYDLQSIYKFLLIFYGLAIFFGILTRIFLSINDSFFMNLIGYICSGTAISMIINIIINNLMRLWVRFRQNLYGDESYLTHTLPIDKKTLYLSKIITGVISLFTSVLVIALTLFIAYYSKENIELLKNMLLPITNTNTIIKFLIAIIIILFLEFVNLLQSGYTGIILGHRKNNMKIGFSVIFGFMVYIVTQVFVLIVLFTTALFNKDIMNLFITNEIININIIKIILYAAILVYFCSMMVCYVINVKLLEKGINVD